MEKLIYAKSKAGLELAWSDLTLGTSAIYRSIVFTEDGYLYTHGKFFRILDATAAFSATYANNIVSLKDGAGNTFVSFDRGIHSVTGDTYVSATTTNGAVTLTHATPITAGSVGPTAASSTSIVVPRLTYNAAGHLTEATTYTATLNQVQTDVATTGTYYLAFAATGAAGTSVLAKNTALNYNVATGLLTATGLAGTLNNKLTLTLNGTANEYNNSAATSVSFYAPTLAGTSGQLLKSGGASGPVWDTPVITINGSSTNDQIPTAAAVWSAIGTGIGANDAMVFKGVINASTNPNYPTGVTGDTWKISTAGKIGGASGVNVEAGDTIICVTDNAGGTQATVGANWTILQTNIDGAVTTGGAIAQGALVIGAGSSSVSTLPNAATAGWLLIGNTGTNSPTWTAPGSFTVQVDGTNFGSAYSPTASKTVNFVKGTNVTLATSGNNITINSSDTASAVDNILDGSNTGTAITYAPYAAQQAKLSFDTSATNPTRSDRLNLNGYLYATKLYSGGAEVLTAHQAVNGMTFNWTNGTNTVLTAYNPLTAADTLTFTQGSGIVLSGTANEGNLTIAHATPSGASSGTSLAQYISATDAFGHVTGRSAMAALTISSPTNSAVNANLTSISYIPNGAKTFKFEAGTNVTMTTATAANEQTITISSLNSWRNVKAYFLSTPAVQGTIDKAELKFGDEFLWNGDTTAGEIKLAWAEVSETGVITYAV